MTKIFDTAWSVATKAAAMQAAGLETVIRYVNHQNSKQLPEKCVNSAEIAAIKSAGLSLAIVFQQRQNQIADFTAGAGRLAAERAFSYRSNVIGSPLGRPIYFSVDADLFRPQELAAVAAFFGAAKTRLVELAAGGPPAPVGVYGSGAVCQHLENQGLASFFWLAQSKAWKDYDAFNASGDWNLLQGDQGTFAGVDGDPNSGNPAHPDFGAFNPQ